MNAKTTKTISPGGDRTSTGFDWTAVDALTDEEIEAAVQGDPDAPPILNHEWFEKAELVLPGRKRPITIRFDEDVLNYFMAKGPGYQSRINAVLKHYVLTKRRLEAARGLAPRTKAPRRRATRKAEA